MLELLRYPGVIYDTMCMVYYCFKISDKKADGNVVVVLGPDTEKARRITNQLIREKKGVRTLQIAWAEAENVLPKALRELIEKGYVQERLRIGHQISKVVQLRLASSLKEELGSLRKKRGFLIDGTFVAALDDMERIRDLYRQFALNPETMKRIPPYKGKPSNIDISLILYSRYSRLPLLTNDKEVYNFAPELSSGGFCEMIKAFPQVKFS